MNMFTLQKLAHPHHLKEKNTFKMQATGANPGYKVAPPVI
jgi:hypothetical protein